MASLPRITFFSHSSIVSGGGEGALMEIIQILQNKAEMCVILPAKGPFSNELESWGVKTEVIDIPWWTEGNEGEGYRARVAMSLDMIKKHLDNFSPDVCMTNTSVIPWGAVAARRQNIPHVWFVHEMLDQNSEIKYQLPLDDTMSIIGELSDLVVANSGYCLKDLSRIIPVNKLINIMPISHLPDARKKAKSVRPGEYKNIPKGSKIMLIAGRILDTKGQEDAVVALAELKKSHPSTHLVLLGDVQEEYKQKMMLYATAHGIKNQVHILPFTKNPYRYMAHADIIINTSRLESFGRSTVEAMALGRPVVGADNSSTAEIIQSRRNGLLYHTGSGEDLADKIRTILDDKNQTKNIVMGGLETVLKMEQVTKDSTVELEHFVMKCTRTTKPKTAVVEYIVSTLSHNPAPIVVSPTHTKKPIRKYASGVKNRIKQSIRRVI